MQTSGDQRREIAKLYQRHCERSEAIHVSTCGAMDCFAALAMTWREQASLVPHLEKAATRPPKREPPPARRTRLPTKQAGNPSGQNVAFCDAAKASTWPLLTGNGNSVRLLCIGATGIQASEPSVALRKNNGRNHAQTDLGRGIDRGTDSGRTGRGAIADRDQVQPRGGDQYAEGAGGREVQGTGREIHRAARSRSKSIRTRSSTRTRKSWKRCSSARCRCWRPRTRSSARSGSRNSRCSICPTSSPT